MSNVDPTLYTEEFNAVLKLVSATRSKVIAEVVADLRKEANRIKDPNGFPLYADSWAGAADYLEYKEAKRNL